MQAMSVAPQLHAEVAADLYAIFLSLGSTDQLTAVAELELTFSQCKLLALLEAEAEELSVKELAGRVGISLPAASRAVESLLQRGFVERREDAEDRRMKRVRITSAGRTARETIYGAKLSALRDFAAALPASDLQRLARALTPVVTRPDVAAHRPRTDGAE